MSGFDKPSESLSEAWSNVQRQWSRTREVWRDSVADRFESEFWSEWEGALPGALNNLRGLEEVLDNIQREAGS